MEEKNDNSLTINDSRIYYFDEYNRYIIQNMRDKSECYLQK